jgi:hypothetical protein
MAEKQASTYEYEKDQIKLGLSRFDLIGTFQASSVHNTNQRQGFAIVRSEKLCALLLIS